MFCTVEFTKSQLSPSSLEQKNYCTITFAITNVKTLNVTRNTRHDTRYTKDTRYAKAELCGAKKNNFFFRLSSRKKYLISKYQSPHYFQHF